MLEHVRATSSSAMSASATRGAPPVLQALQPGDSRRRNPGLTGPNGAGKSTLAHLLMRFADPDAGAVLIDGVNTREATIASVRAQIGLVAQNVLLLNGTRGGEYRLRRAGREPGENRGRRQGRPRPCLYHANCPTATTR